MLMMEYKLSLSLFENFVLLHATVIQH